MLRASIHQNKKIGLPAIVARNTMMDSRSESVILPLVARNVQTANAAFTASNSEDTNFCGGPSHAKDTSLFEASELLKAGASGLVVSLEDLRLFSDDVLRKLFETVHAMNKRTEDELQNLNKLKSLDVNSGVPGKRRMEEVSLLIDAVSQLDEPFLLAIVSTVINALLGRRYLKEGVVPTTNEITFLRYSELDSDGQQRCERHPDGQYICYLPAPILKEMNIVDTPGTNVILQRQQRLTEEFVPRADLLLFVISADRPLTESEVGLLPPVNVV
ncbi:putative transmembrane GTPase FZO-like, chloroplastic [Vitis vinifera]|uniref:Putative transmembrane GTPase FZO-like, chloroplastic n=1 Tax=Vitis vinifera TaxID=29760 RepID=A0A438F480_VITVI|nr:putative transmembrane GTPase FZO-like, chloroplastic [Vitis vinifera]